MEFKNTISILKEIIEDDLYLNQEISDTIKVLKIVRKFVKNKIKPVKINELGVKATLFYVPKGKILVMPPKSTPYLGIAFLPAISALCGNKTFLKPPKQNLELAKKIVKSLNKDIKSAKIKLWNKNGRKAVEDAIKQKFNMILFMGSFKIGKEIYSKCIEAGMEYAGNHDGFAVAIILKNEKNLEKTMTKIKESFNFKNGKDCDSTKIVFIPAGTNLCSSFKEMKIQYYNKIGECIRRINENAFCGLSVSIWGNPKEACQIINKLNVGRITINKNTHEINPLMPWGGVKKSSNAGGMKWWPHRFTNTIIVECFT